VLKSRTKYEKVPDQRAQPVFDLFCIICYSFYMAHHEDDLFGDATAIAFEKLKAGEVDDDFSTIAHDLTVTNTYPAMTEGVLLTTGADLYVAHQTIAKIETGECDRYGEPIKAPSYRRTLIYLSFAQGDIMRNGLRPVGKQILGHCVELSIGLDEEVTTMLVGFQGFDTNAPNPN
jgi:hypothetical protein